MGCPVPSWASALGLWEGFTPNAAVREPPLLSMRHLTHVVADETRVEYASHWGAGPERCGAFGPAGSGKTSLLVIIGSLKSLG